MEPFKYICHYWGKSSKSLTKENDIHLLIGDDANLLI